MIKVKNFHIEKMIIIFLFSLLSLGFIFMDVKIFWHKTEAIFDIWFLQHVSAGIIISFLLTVSKYARYSLLLLILLAYLWEFWEYFIETESYDSVIEWFAWVEHPLNRFLADPLAIILGYLIVKHYFFSIYPAILFVIIFIVLHLFWGWSMVIQNNII